MPVRLPAMSRRMKVSFRFRSVRLSVRMLSLPWSVALLPMVMKGLSDGFVSARLIVELSLS